MSTSTATNPTFNESELTDLDFVRLGLQSPASSDDSFSDRVGELGAKRFSNVVSLPVFQRLAYKPTEFFAAIQEWEGTVTEVGDTHFYANLYDVTNDSSEVSELADIAFEDIDPADKDKVREGAIFRWLIGHSRTRSGTSSRKWVIYFRKSIEHAAAPSIFQEIVIPERFRVSLSSENN